MRSSRCVLLACCIAVAALGCASGPAFRQVAPPPDKALVYIYRPTNYLLGGGVRYEVATGAQRIVYLVPGGYFPYLAEPGEREFWAHTEARASITEYLEPGATYYLKGTVGIGFLVGRPRLEFVDEIEALDEVAECRLLPAAEPWVKQAGEETHTPPPP